MSRRRGEFEHRTSIFEGAYRAWSHLGGLEPLDLTSKSAAELDPLTFTIVTDTRVVYGKRNKRRKYNIPSTETTSISSGSYGAATASVVSVSNQTSTHSTTPAADNPKADPNDPKLSFPYEPLPRTGLQHPYIQAIISPWLGPDVDQDAIMLGLTTLRTWWQHRRKGESASALQALTATNMKGVVEGYTRHFFNLAHYLVTNDGEQPPRTLYDKMKHCGLRFGAKTVVLDGGDTGGHNNNTDSNTPLLRPIYGLHSNNIEYKNPNSFPVVFISRSGDIQLFIKVNGMTCDHCVKIIETVLTGCSGNYRCIKGALDTAASMELGAVIVKIDKLKHAKQIADEAIDHLDMVGYDGEVLEIDLGSDVEGGGGGENKGKSSNMNRNYTEQNKYNSAMAAMENVGIKENTDIFDWKSPCTCPDNAILHEDCAKHSQMKEKVSTAFDLRKKQVIKYYFSKRGFDADQAEDEYSDDNVTKPTITIKNKSPTNDKKHEGKEDRKKKHDNDYSYPTSSEKEGLATSKVKTPQNQSTTSNAAAVAPIPASMVLDGTAAASHAMGIGVPSLYHPSLYGGYLLPQHPSSFMYNTNFLGPHLTPQQMQQLQQMQQMQQMQQIQQIQQSHYGGAAGSIASPSAMLFPPPPTTSFYDPRLQQHFNPTANSPNPGVAGVINGFGVPQEHYSVIDLDSGNNNNLLDHVLQTSTSQSNGGVASTAEEGKASESKVTNGETTNLL